MAELDEVGKAILAALAGMAEPAGCGEIAKKAGLSHPQGGGKAPRSSQAGAGGKAGRGQIRHHRGWKGRHKLK